MSKTDSLADAFTVIRNAVMAKKDTVDIPASNTLKTIMEILKREEYIDTFKVVDDKKQGVVRVYLKYIDGRPAIRNISRVSRPGLRRYARHDELPFVLRGRGMAIITTSKGILTNTQARQQRLGGEIIAYVW